MTTLVLATLTFEGHPMPDGRIRVVLHSQTGQQELTVSLAEWTSLAALEQLLVLVEERHRKDLAEVTRMQVARDEARTEVERLRASHALRNEGYADADYQAVAENIANDPRWANRTDAQRVARWALSLRSTVSQQAARIAELEEQSGHERDHSKMLSEANSALHVEKRAIENYCAKVRGEYTEAARERNSLRSQLAAVTRERDEARAELARTRPIYDLALAWGRAPHVDDANHAAGDCDDCPARPAEAALSIAIERELQATEQAQ